MHSEQLQGGLRPPMQARVLASRRAYLRPISRRYRRHTGARAPKRVLHASRGSAEVDDADPSPRRTLDDIPSPLAEILCGQKI